MFCHNTPHISPPAFSSLHCSLPTDTTSGGCGTMFNHKNTPSAFLKKKDGDQRSFLPYVRPADIKRNVVKESVDTERKSSCSPSIPARSDKPKWEKINTNTDGAEEKSDCSLKLTKISEGPEQKVPDEHVEDSGPVYDYRSVCVSTRWCWADIFTTVNTTHPQGTDTTQYSASVRPTSKIFATFDHFKSSA